MDSRLIDRVETILATSIVAAGGPYDTRDAPNKALQAVGSTSSGSGAATILIQVSLDGVNWLTVGTITLALTTAGVTDGLVISAPWVYLRANVTAISGTGASVSVLLGV